MNRRDRQKGFGVIVAVVILVLLASLAAVMVRTSIGQQSASAQDIAAAYANQAARAGVEWGLYQAMTSSACAPATSLNFTGQNGFNVVVNCDATNFNEGVDAAGAPIGKTIFVISAIACNAANCPNAGAAVAGSDYVERRRMATACATKAAPPNPGGPC
ncbi:MSHA biogenesis protein MshP [Pseudoduganella violacea]|uniref:MSHA biogenesis protein MshP n=1 Tax=Pseudoduganella violacea TaxID=1715466 RepID=A0A7W5FVV6_9BURK|nr:MSHA biogenesis protein MshP [Pseudoduganella violacea]MBB3121237.1 MSHA biogenesis protein MshP [Pseudoduganella violacea]